MFYAANKPTFFNLPSSTCSQGSVCMDEHGPKAPPRPSRLWAWKRFGCGWPCGSIARCCGGKVATCWWKAPGRQTEEKKRNLISTISVSSSKVVQAHWNWGPFTSRVRCLFGERALTFLDTCLGIICNLQKQHGKNWPQWQNTNM